VPLVGLIEPGTVERVLKSVAYAKANVLVLLEQEHRSGHVLFEKGQIVTARVGDLTGPAAVRAMRGWFAGHYSLLKRQKREVEALGHVLLISLELRTRRGFERWLKHQGYTTSIVGYPQHAMQVINYIQPEVVVMNCPRRTLAMSCDELREMLAEELGVPPLLIVVEHGDNRCEEPGPECVRCSAETSELQQVLAQPWPETRLGLRQRGEEATAKIYRPAPLPADLSRVKFQTDDYVTAEPAGGVTARRIALVLGVLLLGSGLIWSVWWAMTK
jgi:hypothetical protein